MGYGIRSAQSHRPSFWPTQRSHAADMFLEWLLGLPDYADIAMAARVEIARLDSAAPLPPGPKRLRELMVEATRPLPEPRRRRDRYWIGTIS